MNRSHNRASTSEALPDSPRISEEPLVPEEDDDQRFQKDLERAKANSLKNDREKVVGESPKKGGQLEIEVPYIKKNKYLKHLLFFTA
jgi:hypothetical protein